jgi:hypothetical protein
MYQNTSKKILIVLRRIKITYVIIPTIFRAAGMFEQSGGPPPPPSKALRTKNLPLHSSFAD